MPRPKTVQSASGGPSFETVKRTVKRLAKKHGVDSDELLQIVVDTLESLESKRKLPTTQRDLELSVIQPLIDQMKESQITQPKAGSRSEAAKRAWETIRARHKKSSKPPKSSKPKSQGRGSAAQRAHATMKMGKRLKVRSPDKIKTTQRGIYAPPKKWWNYMTQQPHGKQQKPLPPAAAGNLWFHVYDDDKRLQIIKEYS